MKFFLDANIPYSTKNVLAESDVSVIHARDVGLNEADDEEIMKFAKENDCILITKDLEFGKLVKTSPTAAKGLVIIRLPHFVKASSFANVISSFLKTIDLEILNDAITVVKFGSYRIRKLY